MLISCTLIANAQTEAETITIEKSDFILDIRKSKEKNLGKNYYKIDSTDKVVEFQIKGNIGEIIDEWTKFMELETVDYRIESIFYGKRMADFEDSVAFENSIYSYDFDVILTNNFTDMLDIAELQREAFLEFTKAIGIEVQTVMEEQVFWKLEIVDTKATTISKNQKKMWNRTETDDYVYYETIPYRRVADLLSRKLDDFVRPIPYDAFKFDIRMPYSDDIFDLKYAMIEQGLELTQVTEDVEVWVIKLDKE